ncbi:hypothetical protein M6B38_246975 [Iris pallida]|uniref:Uncharacterized protein n=1 Tax=Iris pallida TaxID=29817 RepID=A0AAX6DH10_IRIPA|nr:hypothetical protein M6B38_246975 [Iris pallida]
MLDEEKELRRCPARRSRSVQRCGLVVTNSCEGWWCSAGAGQRGERTVERESDCVYCVCVRIIGNCVHL